MSAAVMDAGTLLAAARQLDQAIFEVQVYFAAICAIVTYEWIMNFRREVRSVWQADWTLIKILYLIIRYTGLVHAGVDLWAYCGSWQSSTCKTFVHFIPAIPVIGVVASHLILLAQCRAIWNHAKFVSYLLVPLLVAEVVIMTQSSFMNIEAVPVLSAAGPCIPRAKSALCILYFAFPMAFDLTVTILTAIKCFDLRSQDAGIGVGSSLLNTIIHNSFQYFIFITAANLINIIYYIVDVNSPSSSINGPLAIAATELFACRLTLSLRDVKTLSVPAAGATEKRGLVKVVLFGPEQMDATELATMSSDEVQHRRIRAPSPIRISMTRAHQVYVNSPV